MDLELAEKVFKEADKDEDGLITYVEYFQFIEKCVCQTKARTSLLNIKSSSSIRNHPRNPKRKRQLQSMTQAVSGTADSDSTFGFN